jgi:hypothetical protein
VVTVTTTATNSIPTNQWVTISGVANPSFNGTFQVTGPGTSGTTFRFAQACTNGTSSGGTVTGANPTFSDGLGNYFFYASAGAYTVQVYSFLTSTYYQVDQFVGQFSVLGSANTWTAPQTFNGNVTMTAGQNTLNCKNFEQIRCVDGVNSAAWSGSEAGAWINAAYADLPSTGGDIYVAAGNYSYSTPIVFGTANKPARIVGAPAAGTTLTYTTTSGVAFTYNVGANHQWGGGLESITLSGPGAGTSTTGILLGGSNGAEGVVRRNVKVTGFGTAETYGNNTFLTECQHCVYIGNGAPTLNIPSGLTNSGESFSYVDSTIANPNVASGAGCINVSSPVNNLSFVGGSFDNCQYTQSAGQVHIVNVHFENPSAAMTVPFISVTGGRLSVVNPDYQWDGTTLPSPSAAVACSAGAFNSVGASYFAGSTILTSDLAISGTCEFHDTNMKFTSGFSGFYTNSSSGPVTTFGNPWGNNAILGSGELIIQGAAPQLSLGPTGGNLYNIQANNPAATRTLQISDPGSNSHFVLVVASGTSTLTNSSIGSGACASTVTTSAPNVSGTDAISWSYASFPNAATDGRLILSASVSANNVNFSLCNPTASSLTPSGLTVNWAVHR